MDTVRGTLERPMWASTAMIPDTRARQPRDGPMQCGNQPADISVIHRRYKLRASRSPSGAILTVTFTPRRKIARDTPASLDAGRPYQSLAWWAVRNPHVTEKKMAVQELRKQVIRHRHAVTNQRLSGI